MRWTKEDFRRIRKISWKNCEKIGKRLASKGFFVYDIDWLFKF